MSTTDTEVDVGSYLETDDRKTLLRFITCGSVDDGKSTLIMVDDDRMRLLPGETPQMRKIRFRTQGCYPLTGAVESEAETLPQIIQEMLLTTTSERQGRAIDHDQAASMEKKKREGYF